MALLSALAGAGAMVLGLVVLATRIDVLQFGRHRFDYVMFYVAMGGGCMADGLLLLTGNEQLGIADGALIVGLLAHLSLQREPGKKWYPPAHAITKPAGLEPLDTRF